MLTFLPQNFLLIIKPLSQFVQEVGTLRGYKVTEEPPGQSVPLQKADLREGACSSSVRAQQTDTVWVPLDGLSFESHRLEVGSQLMLP